MPPRQSIAQRNRIATANRISKAYKWDFNRQNPRPRGLSNRGADCYRNATLQILLHLPRFVNWILEHRERGAHWDCRLDDLYMDQPRVDRVSIQMEPHGTGCVPCILKNLVQQYWGPYRMKKNGNGEPRGFERNDPALVGLHNLADRWYSADPIGWPEELARIERSKKKKMTQLEKDEETRTARNRNSAAQHDAEEFMRLILNGVENSYGEWDCPHGTRRKAQYDSLFTLTVAEHHTCLTCKEKKFNQERPELGFRVNPLVGEPDSIEDAIRRVMTDTLNNVDKSTCSRQCPKADIAVEHVIDAAPEYLCICLQLDYYDVAAGEFRKNRSRIQIPEILDITEHMAHQNDDPYPVRYRIFAAIYHAGDALRAGHYAAGVTSGRGQRPGYQKKVMPQVHLAPEEENTAAKEKDTPGGEDSLEPQNPASQADGLQFFCNDTEIFDWNQPATVPNKLVINPVDFSDEFNNRSEWDPYTLWYVREPQTAPTIAAVPVPAVPIDEPTTIGGRLRKRKVAEREVEDAPQPRRKKV